jgi:acyl-CoA thioester hydrolase
MQQVDPAQIQREIDFSTPIQIRFSDIDGYSHVNNGVYFSYFEHSRAVYLYEVCEWDIMSIGTVVARIEIDYMKPVHLEDAIKCFVHCTRTGNSSFDLEQYLVGESKAGGSFVFAKCKCTMVAVDMKTMRPVPIPANSLSKLTQKA